MATSSCSSVRVLDLGMVDELDTATSSFFRDNDAIGAILSWPEAMAVRSTLTSQEKLVELCDQHGVPREFTPVTADQVGWRACEAPPPGCNSNYVCVYSVSLAVGLRFPLHEFYVKLLRHYGLAPSQLTPNAWGYMAAFVLRCEEAGVEPLTSVFRQFFSICAHKNNNKPLGWHHFSPCTAETRRLFIGSPGSMGNDWKSKFFFLRSPASSCKVSMKWGKPLRKDARSWEHTNAIIEKLKRMGFVDVKGLLANSVKPVGVLALMTVKAETSRAAAEAEAAAFCTKRKSPPPGAASTSVPPQPVPTSSTTWAPIRASHIHQAPQEQSFAVPTSVALGFAPIRAAAGPGGGSEASLPHPHRFAGSTPSSSGLARTTGVNIGAGSRRQFTTPAPHLCASDKVQLWDAMAEAEKQTAMVNKLMQELHVVKCRNVELGDQLRAAAQRNERLIELYGAERAQLYNYLHTARGDVANLKAEYAAGIARLKQEHAEEKALLKEELKAENAQLRNDHAAEAEQLQHHSYAMGLAHMRDLAVRVYPYVEASQLDPELLINGNYKDLGSGMLSGQPGGSTMGNE